jgi:hypothetical protein
MNRVEARAAAMILLDGYKTANDGDLLQTFPTRPMSLHPPAAFVESINTSDVDYTAAVVMPNWQVTIRFVRGLVSRGDVVDANDALIDNFWQYVLDNKHAAGGATLTLPVESTDDDGWIPEWMPDSVLPYYSTTFVLSTEGQFSAL